jgi:hypothetical protein
MTSENSFRLPGGGKFCARRGRRSAKKIAANKVDAVCAALHLGFMNLSLGMDARFRQGPVLAFFKIARRVDLRLEQLPNERLKTGNIFVIFSPRTDDI